MEVMDAKRVRNGSHGQLWLNGEVAAEAYGCKIVVSKTKETVPRCGAFMEGSKLMSAKITGTVQLYNATSRLIQAEAEALREGRDVRFTLISKLADPDAVSTQRILATGVSFDDLTLGYWVAALIGKIPTKFPAAEYTVLDS